MAFTFINLETIQMVAHQQALISILTDVIMEHQKILKDLGMQEI